MKKPILFIVSAASGSGKTTLCKHLFKVFPNKLASSISATARSPRPGEIEGKDYYFLSEDEFEKKIKNDAFLEHAIIYGGSSKRYYGTLRSSVYDLISSGKSVLCEIDVQGFYQIKKNYEGPVVSVFIDAPSLEIIEQRLRARGTNTEQEIQERLITAKKELLCRKDYDHVVLNDDLETAKRDIVALFRRYLG